MISYVRKTPRLIKRYVRVITLKALLTALEGL